ncbi:hypothetical protein FOQG_02321 [Fusarium oxysporum f. sp. raphani 54005]|uniref:Uncharacterized protein n=6 Tax=Fusarium oxysporum TaxID=5507 RepID=X0CS23_FUSOX|nr:hypothetical protein FOXG_19529 [Fusarium oxysporum f. sp. lycopersici 4287]EWZ48477.1 hypothetical protein FOZG_04023 [Fusarium oxysporum Fo47]EWZ93544.1 hypothetical protein FOWG_06260 [Fusarium oxysporum f. sp. lycopersici MN25]EXA41967.1 hypothetical protein FOVG_07367 [Fusarium oxysporum f. sp. pisi HDV247]EXK45820.1 hypothetical protein FOMG_04104 [Fusarium oxysporum f. sp. melonis 26406]EXK96946.1 hypothetical protein FOQG_02321 [Fusarium oxysporum f. sp. raphani 54005]EXL53808.1 hy
MQKPTQKQKQRVISRSTFEPREHGPRLPNLTNGTNWNLSSKETLQTPSLLACPGLA